MDIMLLKQLVDDVQTSVVELFQTTPLDLSKRLKQLSMETGKLSALVNEESRKIIH